MCRNRGLVYLLFPVFVKFPRPTNSPPLQHWSHLPRKSSKKTVPVHPSKAKEVLEEAGKLTQKVDAKISGRSQELAAKTQQILSPGPKAPHSFRLLSMGMFQGPLSSPRVELNR
jgi:hypothetical protein